MFSKCLNYQIYLGLTCLVIGFLFIALTVGAQINDNVLPDTPPLAPDMTEAGTTTESNQITSAATTSELSGIEELTELSTPDISSTTVSDNALPNTPPLAPDMTEAGTTTESNQITSTATTTTSELSGAKELTEPPALDTDISSTTVKIETPDDSWYPLDFRDCHSPKAREYFGDRRECIRMIQDR